MNLNRLVNRSSSASARIAFTFLVLNCSAVVGLWSVLTRKKIWR